MFLKTPLITQCLECQNIIEVEGDMDCVDTDDRSMGTEYEFESIIEDNCPCCGNPLYVKISVWEYPQGMINDYDIDIDGAEIITPPVFSCSF